MGVFRSDRLRDLFVLATCFWEAWSFSGSKVTLEEVTSKPEKFCSQLKNYGFAIVQCNLERRTTALEWLDARHDVKAQLLEGEFGPGLSRCADVDFPRRLRRLDLVAESGGAGSATEIQGLALELHQVALRCLGAIAQHEELPLMELVAQQSESLEEAKEPSFLRANIYSSNDGGAGPCWHVDLGLLTVMPVGSWPAMMASPFHACVGENAFIEELLDPERDVMVFAGTALLLATAGLGYLALVHGVSAARLRQGSSRISLPYFLRVKRGGVVQRPATLQEGSLACLYPAAVQPGDDEPPMLDLLRFHRDFYGRLCTRGQVVSLEGLARDPALEQRIREEFYT